MINMPLRAAQTTPFGELRLDELWTTDSNPQAAFGAARQAVAELEGVLAPANPWTAMLPASVWTRYYLTMTKLAEHMPLLVVTEWMDGFLASANFSILSPQLRRPATPFVATVEFGAGTGKSHAYQMLVTDTLATATISIGSMNASVVPGLLSVSISHLDSITVAPAGISDSRPQETAKPLKAGLTAYAKFKQLGRWLELNDEQTADLIDVGRTTPYAWERAGTEPRPSRAGLLYEYHALLSSLARRLGPEGLEDWLHTGSPRHIDMLRQGRLKAAYDASHGIIFGIRLEPEGGLGALQDEDQVAPPTSAGSLTTDDIRGDLRRPRKPRV